MEQKNVISNMEKAVLERIAKDNAANTEKCKACGNPQLQQAGVCKVCPACGETTGCS